MTNHLETMTAKDAMDVNPARIMRRLFSKGEERIIPLLQYLNYNDSLTPEQRRCVAKSQIILERMHILFSNMAELFGAHDLVSAVQIANYDVEIFLTKIIKNTLRYFDNTTLEIILDVRDCKFAAFDARRMELIIYNLISNAILHNNKKEKQITISATTKDNSLLIDVTDNGRGIPQKIAKNIMNVPESSLNDMVFEYDFDAGTVKGLSIYISKKLVCDMKGSIQSVTYTKGGKVLVRVPQNNSDIRQDVFQEDDSFVVSDRFAKMAFASAILNESFDDCK